MGPIKTIRNAIKIETSLKDDMLQDFHNTKKERGFVFPRNLTSSRKIDSYPHENKYNCLAKEGSDCSLLWLAASLRSDLSNKKRKRERKIQVHLKRMGKVG